MIWIARTFVVLVVGAFASYVALLVSAIRDYDANLFNE